MKISVSRFCRRGALVLLLWLVGGLSNAFAVQSGLISDTNKYAWSENSGWLNFKPAGGGVTVYDTYLAGYVWAANVGWIKLGSTATNGTYGNTTSSNWGVNRNATTGVLSGYAWSENVGWISFNHDQGYVTISPSTGDFSGYAWSANVGFINFNNVSPAYKVGSTAKAPGVPTGVAATRGNTSALVAFTAPAANGGPAATGYTVTSTPGGKTGTGASSPITVSGLTNGTAYTFTVKATNAFGTGASSAASASITPATVPGAPTGVVATKGNASAQVAFVAPAANGSPITGYTVTSTPAVVGKPSWAGTKSPIAVTGLINGTAYTFTVKATNAVGTGVASVASASITPATVPGAPTGVVATKGNLSAQVAFVAPASNGGAVITGYTITVISGGKTVKTLLPSLANPTTITGLTNGTAYTFTVKATNAVGTGAASVVSTPVTPAAVPGAPTAVVATRLNASAKVTFTPPASKGGSPITSYTVTSTPGGKIATGVASPLAVTGLTNGTAYTFTVKATNASGSSFASTPSNSVIPATVPGAPTIGVVTKGNASALVVFTAPVSTGGSAITSYTVTSTPGNKIATGTKSPLTVTGLTNGTAYRFTVKATNAVGSGVASALSASVTPAPVPGVPTGVVATKGNASASVAFIKPVSTGGSAITSYTVTSTPGGKTVTGTKSPLAVTGLTNGTAYTFTVKATNASGPSFASAPSNSVVPGP